jgi:transposase-like protein
VTTRETTKAYRINQWTQIIRECRNSGQTVSDWCESQGIDPKKYYYWLKCVRKAASDALPATMSNSSIVPINLNPTDTSQPLSIANEVVATISAGNVVVQLSNHASTELITNVLRAMQNAR